MSKANRRVTDLNGEDMILWFDDLGTGNEGYNFLSNFYEGEPIILPTVFWQGATDKYGYTRYTDPEERTKHPVEFLTGEHAFQAMKCPGSGLDFHRIATASDPGIAKGYGRTCSLRSDWEEVKYDVMCAVVRAKFTLQREEGQRLLDTGDRLLCEFTFWKDTVWGVDGTQKVEDGLWQGRNWLGTILMARRAELRALQTFGTKRVENLSRSTGVWNSIFSN